MVCITVYPKFRWSWRLTGREQSEERSGLQEPTYSWEDLDQDITTCGVYVIRVMYLVFVWLCRVATCECSNMKRIFQARCVAIKSQRQLSKLPFWASSFLAQGLMKLTEMSGERLPGLSGIVIRSYAGHATFRIFLPPATRHPSTKIRFYNASLEKNNFAWDFEWRFLDIDDWLLHTCSLLADCCSASHGPRGDEGIDALSLMVKTKGLTLSVHLRRDPKNARLLHPVVRVTLLLGTECVSCFEIPNPV